MKKSLLLFSILFLSFILIGCNTAPRKENTRVNMAKRTTPATGTHDTEPALNTEPTALSENTDIVAPTTPKKKHPAVAKAKTEPPAPVSAPEANTANAPVAANDAKPVVVRKILAKSKVVSYMGQDYCKTYRATTVVNGVTQKSFGIACKQPSGKWRIMN